MNDLRFDRVGVGRKRRIFHQDFETRFRRPIKCGHHQVQVHREAVHTDDFDRLRADESRGRIAQCLVIRIPRRFRVEMRVHAEVCPVIQFLFDDLLRRLSASSQANCPRNKSAARRSCRLANEIFRGKRAVDPRHRAVARNLRQRKICMLV